MRESDRDRINLPRFKNVVIIWRKLLLKSESHKESFLCRWVFFTNFFAWPQARTPMYVKRLWFSVHDLYIDVYRYTYIGMVLFLSAWIHYFWFFMGQFGSKTLHKLISKKKKCVTSKRIKLKPQRKHSILSFNETHTHNTFVTWCFWIIVIIEWKLCALFMLCHSQIESFLCASYTVYVCLVDCLVTSYIYNTPMKCHLMFFFFIYFIFLLMSFGVRNKIFIFINFLEGKRIVQIKREIMLLLLFISVSVLYCSVHVWEICIFFSSLTVKMDDKIVYDIVAWYVSIKQKQKKYQEFGVLFFSGLSLNTC